jgi:hypothetical protein
MRYAAGAMVAALSLLAASASGQLRADHSFIRAEAFFSEQAVRGVAGEQFSIAAVDAELPAGALIKITLIYRRCPAWAGG